MNDTPFENGGLTSSQAASLLGVHESTVKRWGNLGDLSLVRTAGGHRRIDPGALIDFARRKSPDSELLFFSPHEEEVAWAALAAQERNDFEELRDLLLRFCDSQPGSWVKRLLVYLEHGFGITRDRLFDGMIAPALGEVGLEWKTGSRTIALEHRFTQKIVDALHALGVPASRPRPGHSRRALVACAEKNRHEIAALMTRRLLEGEGWEVTYLGADVPFEEVAGIQEMEKASLVCLGFTAPQVAADARRGLRVLSALYSPLAPYTLALGGVAATPDRVFAPAPFPVHCLDSMQELMAWVRAKFPPVPPVGGDG
jgi:excisionase family DNA binding protein